MNCIGFKAYELANEYIRDVDVDVDEDVDEDEGAVGTRAKELRNEDISSSLKDQEKQEKREGGADELGELSKKEEDDVESIGKDIPMNLKDVPTPTTVSGTSTRTSLGKLKQKHYEVLLSWILQLAHIYTSLGHANAALTALDDAHNLHRTFAHVFTTLAQGNAGEGVLDNDSDLGSILFYRGTVHFLLLGEQEKAARLFNQSIHLQPCNFPAYWSLAKSLRANSRGKEQGNPSSYNGIDEISEFQSDFHNRLVRVVKQVFDFHDEDLDELFSDFIRPPSLPPSIAPTVTLSSGFCRDTLEDKQSPSSVSQTALESASHLLWAVYETASVLGKKNMSWRFLQYSHAYDAWLATSTATSTTPSSSSSSSSSLTQEVYSANFSVLRANHITKSFQSDYWPLKEMGIGLRDTAEAVTPGTHV